MQAKVDVRVFHVHSAFAAEANVFGPPCERGVAAQLLAALRIGHQLGILLLFKVAIQGNKGLVPGQHQQRLRQMQREAMNAAKRSNYSGTRRKM